MAAPKAAAPKRGQGLALVRYRSLFSGPAVERVRQLQFQRPLAEVELSYEDATAAGSSPAPRSRSLERDEPHAPGPGEPAALRKGVVRIPSEHAKACTTASR